MDKIIIHELEVCYRVGVPEAERACPQRLVLCVELTRDFSRAACSDDVADTIDYYQVVQCLIHFGDNRSWRLIEKLASDVAELLLKEYSPENVVVEVRKFVIPEAGYVAVRVSRKAPSMT